MSEAPAFDTALDERLEYRLRLVVVPVTLLVSWLLTATGAGRMLGRIFLSMWLHEIGHAVAAWLCGILAFPGPWVTPMGSGRSAVVVLLLAVGLAALGYRSWRRKRPLGVAVAGALLLLQLVCSLMPLRSARVLITFCGDGGGMVLGALLVCTFYVGAEHPLRTRWLRWGFVVIGAFGLADPARTWWAARTDFDAIPFGHIEGAGLSDPSRLEAFGWSAARMTRGYLLVALLCLLVILAVHVRGVWQARAALRQPQP